MDVFGVISELAASENLQCIDCIVGAVVPDPSYSKYAFALVHCPGTSSHGLFVYRYQNAAVMSTGDLLLVRAMPITSDFYYYLGTSTVDQAIFQVKITAPQETPFMVEVPFEPKSSNFFMSIKKCINSHMERLKQNIAPPFHWMDKYRAQVAATLGHGPALDPFGVATFYAPAPATIQALLPEQTRLDDPFAEFANERRKQSGNASVMNRSSKMSTNAPQSSDPHAYVNCPKDPGFLVDFDGNILTPPMQPQNQMMVHPPPPPGDPWRQSNHSTDISSLSTSSSTSSLESKACTPLLGFENDFKDIVKTSTVQAVGTLYENASTASMTNSSSTGSFDQFADLSTRSSTLLPDEDETDRGYATIKPVFKPAGIRPEILKRREADYTFPHVFRVFVGTWNVNGQTVSEDLGPWLHMDQRKADIYAVGFQELDLSKEAFLFNDSAREEEWSKAIEKTLSRVGSYIKVKLVRLVGMMLLVFARERHAPFIRDVIAQTVGTGIMGKMGNKGGVAVRFEFHNTSFCFVNSHLAAHMEEYERRNQDYNDICSRMKFDDESFRQPLSIIKDHEVVVWMGDLNYRITDLTVDVVKVLIEDGDLRNLLEHDQLYRQHRIKKVFKEFSEGEVTFRPTYKYDPGTDNWDTSEKQRVPAWCDRILFKGPAVNQVVYRSHDRMKLSDHKPVSSLFDIKVKVVDEKKFKQVVEEEIRKLDRQENEALPQVALSKNNLDFKDVYFMEPQVLALDVANIGQVNTVAKFVNKLDDTEFCKPWLKVEPSEVFMMPGDSVEIIVTVLVDKNSVASLNTGEDVLEDILVFHLDNGKDYYITVSGNYYPSSFGASIEALVQMHSPIREVTLNDLKRLESGQGTEEEAAAAAFERFDIPKEVWMLVDHLFRNATKQENLFSEEGLHKDILLIRDCLDIGFPEEMPDNLHSVAEALLIFLESLREPVIPYKYYNKCLEGANSFILCKQVLGQIPQSHRNVFKYLAAFIRELLLNSDENKLDTKTIATVFGEIFLRVPPSERSAHNAKGRAHIQQVTHRKASFTYQFMSNEYDE